MGVVGHPFLGKERPQMLQGRFFRRIVELKSLGSGAEPAVFGGTFPPANYGCAERAEGIVSRPAVPAMGHFVDLLVASAQCRSFLPRGSLALVGVSRGTRPGAVFDRHGRLLSSAET